MAFYFTLQQQQLMPLQYSPQYTGQDLYNHVQQQLGCLCELQIDNQGQMVTIDPTWNVGDCFPYGDYQLIVISSQPPSQQLLTNVYVNSSLISEIQIPIEASLLQIVQQIDLQGLSLQSYQLFDSNGAPLVQDTDVPMVQFMGQATPLQLNIIAEAAQKQQQQPPVVPEPQQKVLELNVYLSGVQLYQIQVQSISSLLEIVQQIEIPQGQKIQQYGLYDVNGSPLSVDQDAQLTAFLTAAQPFSINIVTENAANQQSLVQVQVYLNGEQTNTQDCPAETSLLQIVNGVLPAGAMMQSYILYDANSTPLVDSKDIQLQNYSTVQQPLILNITTTRVSVGVPAPVPINQQQAFQPPRYSNAPFIQQQPEPIPQIVQQIQPPKQTATERAKSAMKELKILPKFSLLIDPDGEFVVYKFHLPVMVSGFLKKETSSEKKSFKKSKYQWVEVNKLKYAETSDYGFAIEWDNGFVSKFKLNLL